MYVRVFKEYIYSYYSYYTSKWGDVKTIACTYLKGDWQIPMESYAILVSSEGTIVPWPSLMFRSYAAWDPRGTYGVIWNLKGKLS